MKTFFMKQNYFFLIPTLWGVYLLKKEELIYFWTQGFHFYIYSRKQFSVKIVSHDWTYIFLSSSTILKKKVTLSNKGSQSDGIAKWKKVTGLR